MKTPFVTKDQLEAIAAQYPTPFHIYDEKGIRENARRLKAAFAWNPGYREYFAVKATPTPAILKILKEEGCGCDCSSEAELVMAERCGVTGEGIMFSSNDTPAEEFRLAGVGWPSRRNTPGSRGSRQRRPSGGGHSHGCPSRHKGGKGWGTGRRWPPAALLSQTAFSWAVTSNRSESRGMPAYWILCLLFYDVNCCAVKESREKWRTARDFLGESLGICGNFGYPFEKIAPCYSQRQAVQ